MDPQPEPPTHPALAELGERIWQWRARTQPRSRDDIPRLDRPAGWSPDFSAAAVVSLRSQRRDFAAELESLPALSEIADRVDARLLGSLLARVEWELDTVRAWQQQPRFYLDQSLGPVFDVLLRPGVDGARVDEVVARLTEVDRILRDGRVNLTGHAVAEFTDLALAELTDPAGVLDQLADALGRRFPERAGRLRAVCATAVAALTSYRSFLLDSRPTMPRWEPVGERAYQRFLREVALIPLSPTELMAIGRQEFDRAVVLERVETSRGHRPIGPGTNDAAAQAEWEATLEQSVRRFYTDHDLLSQPAELGHYRNLPMPDYLEPLRFLGVSDDLTSPTRLDENGVSYVPSPGPELPYFYAANAIDPRAGIVHEGAHYQQLALSWRHSRPLRRHFYDSGPNEGIAFYNEEMMLTAGLFEDAPQVRPIIYNFMRLRALRVTVDVGLATGRLTIAQAARQLALDVPMDEATATEEAAAFAEGPGQAISYQIGKTQILALLADALRRPDTPLSLRQLHDFLWRNGNVPIALLRWELLGLTDELDRIGVAGA